MHKPFGIICCFLLLIVMLSAFPAHADTLILPEQLEVIEEEAFMGDISITEAVIPDSVSRMGDRAFAQCTNLTTITFPPTEISFGMDVFDGCSSLVIYCYEDTSAHAYAEAHGIEYSLLDLEPEYTELTLGVPVQVRDLPGGEWAYFSFTPAQSGTYVFSSEGDAAPYALFFNAVMDLIVDDSSSGNDSNFCISHELNAGEPYYLWIEHSDTAASFTVKVTGALPDESGLVYAENSDGTYTVAGYRGNASSVEIPDTYNGRTVTRIGNSAFASCQSLVEISLPDSITKLGAYCFMDCTRLEHIMLPDSVTMIGNGLFTGCSSLTVVNFSSARLTEIPVECCMNCTSLVNVYFPDALDRIAYNAFKNCTSLTQINFPDTLGIIESEAFRGCSRLSQVTIPASTYWVGNLAFALCSSLESIQVEDGNDNYQSIDDVLYNADGSELIQYPAGKRSISYEIPSGVTGISAYAFYGCSHLRYVIIPEWVTDISDEHTFDLCPNLTIYCAPGSFAETYATEHNIPCITDDGEPPEGEVPIPEIHVGDAMLANITSSSQTFLFSFVPPENGTYVFYTDYAHGGKDTQGYLYDADMNQLEHVACDDDHNFYLVCDLTEGQQVYFGVEYASLWYYTSTGLIPVMLEKTTEHLIVDEPAMGYIVNGGDMALFSFVPEESGFYVFSSEGSYDTIGTLYDADMNELGSDDDSGEGSNFRLAVCLDADTQYFFGAKAYSNSYTGFVRTKLEAELTWRTENDILYFSGSVPIPDSSWGDKLWPGSISEVVIAPGITAIGEHAFSQLTRITSVSIPDTVTFIGERAFYGCSSLNAVVIPDSVTEIEAYAFANCSSLASVSLPESITRLSDATFSGCSSLTGIIIPDSVTELGDFVFEGAGLTAITFPDSIASLGGERLLASCTRLSSVHIPDSVTTIGRSTFAGCSSLEEITIPDSVTSIQMNAFMGSGLRHITIPDSIEILTEGVFGSCEYLESITLPNTLQGISWNVFQNCIRLESVTIPYGVTSIGAEAFKDCTSLKSIIIPRSVTDIPGGAFDGCPELTIQCYPGSYAEEYCEEWNYPYAYII